jgi:hypothetical protein
MIFLLPQRKVVEMGNFRWIFYFSTIRRDLLVNMFDEQF